jgi:hypothetical protein
MSQRRRYIRHSHPTDDRTDGFLFSFRFTLCFCYLLVVSTVLLWDSGWLVGWFSITALSVWRWSGCWLFPTGFKTGREGRKREEEGEVQDFLVYTILKMCHLSGLLGLSIPCVYFQSHSVVAYLGSLYSAVSEVPLVDSPLWMA